MNPLYDDDEDEDYDEREDGDYEKYDDYDDYDKWAREGDKRYDEMIDQMMIEKFHGK